MPPKLSLSRGLQDRMKLAEMLKRVFGAVSEEIAARRAELLSAELRPGEAMPDAEMEHELYFRLLDRRLDVATEAEKSYRLSAMKHKVLSRQQDDTTAELSRRLGRLRQIVDLARGKGTSKRLLAFKGRTQRRQQGVLAQAAGVLARLDEMARLHQPKSGDSVVGGVSEDPKDWIAMIRPGYERLEAESELVLHVKKLLDKLLIEKEKAFEAFDETARGLIHIAEGQCRLVGRKDLAKRIRRFCRKRGRPGPKPKKKAKKGKKVRKATSEPETEVAKLKRKLSKASAKIA